MKRLVLCCGSENKGDSLAFGICDALKKKLKRFDFAKCSDVFEMTEHLQSRETIIVDVVKGLKKTRLFKGAGEFAKTKTVTVHELDICSLLKMLEASEKKQFAIIGVPFGLEKTKAAKEVEEILTSLP